MAASAVAVLSTGCDTECRDQFDCRNEGSDFTCVAGECVDQAPLADAGVDDGGTADGGEDAGIGDGGAGPVDAGPVDAGPDCTGGNLNCAGPFRCAPDPDGERA